MRHTEAPLKWPPDIAVRQRRFLSGDKSGKFQFNLIDVTPSPVFSWFEGPHDRVTRPVEVFPRVLVFG
jgi:hypothetical protein